MEDRPEYLDDALAMIGKGYEIHPPTNVIQEGDDGLPEERTDEAWIKISTAFLRTMKKLRGAKLAVWMAIALRINEKYVSFPSIKKIQDDTGLSNREVISTVKELEEMGYLKVRRGGTHNTYYVKMFAGFGASDPILPGSEESSPVNSATSVVNSVNASPVKSSLKQEEREQNKRVPEKKGDILDGILAYSKKDDEVEQVLIALEVGLRVNIDRSLKNQQVAKRIVKDGRPVERWLAWVKSDEWRLAHLGIYRNMERVWGEWPQAFEETHATNPAYEKYVPPDNSKAVPNPFKTRPNFHRGEEDPREGS